MYTPDFPGIGAIFGHVVRNNPAGKSWQDHGKDGENRSKPAVCGPNYDKILLGLTFALT